jgi:hypothetical protein
MSEKTGKTEKTPAQRTAEAQAMIDAGDQRPLSQIVAENLATEQAGQNPDGTPVTPEKDASGTDKAGSR